MAEAKSEVRQLNLDEALQEQEQKEPEKPVTLEDGTVLKWADSEDKEFASDQHELYDKLQGEIAIARRNNDNAISHQGISDLKAMGQKRKQQRQGR